MHCLTILSILCMIVGGGTFPLHASCKIQWTFQAECENVKSVLLQQIADWTGDAGCGQGEKCLYKLESEEADKIIATHTTPKKHYVDNLTFTFEQNGNVCNVQGYSSSETWYAVLDYGTNYCNLENLITGSGLDKKPGYQEVTSNSVCTQYSSHNCDKY